MFPERKEGKFTWAIVCWNHCTTSASNRCKGLQLTAGQMLFTVLPSGSLTLDPEAPWSMMLRQGLLLGGITAEIYINSRSLAVTAQNKDHCWFIQSITSSWSKRKLQNVHQSMFSQEKWVAKAEKNLPAMWEMWVWSLGWENPLEKGMATHSSILAWKIPWTEEPGGLQFMGSQRVRHNWVNNTQTHTFCLSNNMDLSLYINIGNALEPEKHKTLREC